MTRLRFYLEYALAFSLSVVLYVAIVLGAVYLIGCGAKQAVPAKPGVVEVSIVAMPPRPSCYIAPRPEPPKLKELDHGVQDVIRRTMVHWHEQNDLITYLQSMSEWAVDIERCLVVLQGGEP